MCYFGKFPNSDIWSCYGCFVFSKTPLESFRILRFEVVMGVSIVNTKEIQIRRAKRAGGIFWGDFIGNTKEIQKEIQSRWRWPF